MLSKKISIGILSVLVILIICAVLFRVNITHEEFDSLKWKTADLNTEDNISVRWDMMNSLRNNYKLIGMSKADVIELLGEPDNKSVAEYLYHLGYTGTGINTGSLTIKFDHKNRVSNIVVWQG